MKHFNKLLVFFCVQQLTSYKNRFGYQERDNKVISIKTYDKSRTYL